MLHLRNALEQQMNNLESILVCASETERVIYIPTEGANAPSAPHLRHGENAQSPTMSLQRTNPHPKLHFSQGHYCHIRECLTFFKLIIMADHCYPPLT